MKLDVLEVILWSKGPHPPRRVPFKAGKVNVITGDSKTGKTAIVPIIDYCLAANHCAIPTRTIRDACAWFGLVIDTADGLKLLARREPGGQQSTDVMFVLEGDALKVDVDGKVIVPDRIDAPNATAEQVKSLLNRLAGISNLDLEPDSKAIEARRPSIRDFMAFVFQPQNVVANPDVFFFKANTTEHREKHQGGARDNVPTNDYLDRISGVWRAILSALSSRDLRSIFWRRASAWAGLFPVSFKQAL